jgi:hypothetical protein
MAATVGDSESFPAIGGTYTVAAWAWAKTTETENNNNNHFPKGDTCGIVKGGTVSVYSHNRDGTITGTYDPPGAAAGTMCPTAKLIMKVTDLVGWHSDPPSSVLEDDFSTGKWAGGGAASPGTAGGLTIGTGTATNQIAKCEVEGYYYFSDAECKAMTRLLHIPYQGVRPRGPQVISTSQPIPRTYTLSEIDRMRAAEKKRIMVTQSEMSVGMPAISAQIEDRVRTDMAGGVSPDEVEHEAAVKP